MGRVYLAVLSSSSPILFVQHRKETFSLNPLGEQKSRADALLLERAVKNVLQGNVQIVEQAALEMGEKRVFRNSEGPGG